MKCVCVPAFCSSSKKRREKEGERKRNIWMRDLLQRCRCYLSPLLFRPCNKIQRKTRSDDSFCTLLQHFSARLSFQFDPQSSFFQTKQHFKSTTEEWTEELLLPHHQKYIVETVLVPGYLFTDYLVIMIF